MSITFRELEEEVLDYIQRNYERRYRVTLAPTLRNFYRAIDLWNYATWNHLRLIEALRWKYGRRDRRMENFLRECKLWKRKEGWLHLKIVVKLDSEYINSEPLFADSSFEYLTPLFSKLDDKDISNEFLYIVEDLGWFVPWKIHDPSFELEGFTYRHPRETKQRVVWKITIKKKGAKYDYEYELEVDDYAKVIR